MTSPIRRSDSRRVRETYTGPIVHCRHWRDQHELDRLHVAVIGGGSALARVVPPVVEQARRVTVFQHDPIWILPTPPVPGAGLLLRQLPAPPVIPARFWPESNAISDPTAGMDPGQKHAGMTEGAIALAGRLVGLVLRHVAATNLRLQVADSWQRRQLTPDQAAGVRVHSRYYRALGQQNCTLIAWPVARLAPHGIRTVDGVEHRVDCIIYAEDKL
ncbi:NAD(P)/FAD-dependent oxidoreductase [Nocardia heshunensis]